MNENKDLNQQSGFVIREELLKELENTSEPQVEEILPELPKPPKKEKRKEKQVNSITKNVIWIALIFIISFTLALGGIYAGADYLGLGFGRGANCEINIEPGTSVSEITEKLEDVGAVKLPFLFKAYCKLMKYDSQFKYGYYHFNTESGYEAIAQMLINQGAKAEVVKVTIPEGSGINDYTKNVNGEDVTVKGIATILENAGVCTKSDFIIALKEFESNSNLLSNVNKGQVYYNLEGYLFPDTYEFYKLEDSAESAKRAVEKLVNEMEKRITDEMYERAEELNLNMNEVLTLASIVELESGGKTAEMPNVAAVFINRLNSANFATLGSSPTIYYGNSFKNDDGRYNTYNIEGLPPGPLCSPGIDSINAVLYYTENSPYYYFVTDKSGKFYYHKTLEEQNKTINALKQGNNWIYEYY